LHRGLTQMLSRPKSNSRVNDETPVRKVAAVILYSHMMTSDAAHRRCDSDDRLGAAWFASAAVCERTCVFTTPSFPVHNSPAVVGHV
jgi:hypothetical protein